MLLVVKDRLLHLCSVAEPGADDPRTEAAPKPPMASRELIDVHADVVAAYAAGLDIDELAGIYGLERAVVERIVGSVGEEAETKRRSRWLAAVTRRRHDDDAHPATG